MNSCRGALLAVLVLSSATTRADDWALTGNLGAHDPTILKEGNLWWVGATGTGLPIKYSSDGRSWTQGVRRFASELSWWRTYAPNMGANDVWAPDVRAFNGRVWMYYAVSEFGKNNSAIGLTSASSMIAGDWRDDGLVLSSRSGAQSYNAIDPHFAVDAAGSPWLVFGSWFSGIHVTRLDPKTMKPTGALTRIAARSGGIEAPNIVYANGFYYLFVSLDRCCQGVNSTYKIAYGRSRSITGPYLDRSGVDMSNGGGTILEASIGRYVGPGGQSVVQVGSAWMIIRHFYDASANGAAKMRIGDLYWDASGWPTLTRPAAGDTSPPSAPGVPVASSVTSSGVTLTWAASTDDVGVTGYTVYQRESAGDVAVATPAVASVTLGGLTSASSYTFVVRARDAAGNVSAASPSSTVTTSAGTTSYALNVTRAGAGAGTVTSSPAGIQCGTACTASFASGTTVTLTAAAAAGSVFSGWSGTCTGAGTCSTTLTAVRSVTATFDASQGGTAPCANPITFTGQSGSLGTTGAVCLRTGAAVNGWGCSNFEGRTVSVNGGTATDACGAGPFPLARSSDGYTYFSVTAGTYPWASLYTW